LGGATLVGSASPTFVNGVATWSIYAPLSAGTFSVNGVFALTKAAITTSASVADPNATALSTLIASIQSINDKLTAQITVLNAQVVSLQTQITASQAAATASQAAATAAAAQAKADYNKLATAWNKAHPTKKVALKK
jgi:capsule polysaccharide export protein KpsE/RkpR